MRGCLLVVSVCDQPGWLRLHRIGLARESSRRLSLCHIALLAAAALARMTSPQRPSAARDTQQEPAAPLSLGSPDRWLHLPLSLPQPPRPLQAVRLEDLVLDDAYRSAPRGFLLGHLRQQGAGMLAVVGASSAHDAPSAAQWRLVDVPEQPSTKAHFAPTHLLDIRSSRSREHAVVPVHGLLFASCCRSLPFISSAPEQQPTLLSHANLPRTPRPASEHASRLLPVVPLSLPSVAAFSLVQRWIYHHDAAALLATLLGEPFWPADAGSSTPGEMVERLAKVDEVELQRRVSTVHDLWQDVVALEIADEELWQVMRQAWQALMHALSHRHPS